MERNPAEGKATSQTPLWGELILQNGRLKGTRRMLGYPTTFLGRSYSCDIRLNVDGISPLHCVVIQGPDAFVIRDLESGSGTYVNGRRVTHQALHDGDRVEVGPFLFAVQVTAEEAGEPRPRLAPWRPAGTLVPGDVTIHEREALRIQVAAVAAQQSALTEQERRLTQRQGTLEQQQAELAAHLEEKRSKLVELSGQTQAAREQLQKDRREHEERVEEARQKLAETEDDLLERQAEVRRQQKRFRKLRGTLKKRFEKHWVAQQRAMARRERELAEGYGELRERHAELERARAALAEECLRFNSEVELGRRQLEDRRRSLRAEESGTRRELAREWRESRERLEAIRRREEHLLGAEEVLRDEQDRAARRVAALREEGDALEARVATQRQTMHAQRQEIAALQQTLDGLRGEAADRTPDRAGCPLAPPPPPEHLIENWLPRVLARSGPPTGAAATPDGPPAAGADLEELCAAAGELEDQRLLLVEHWQRLLARRAEWEAERDGAAAELSALAARLHRQAQGLLGREAEIAAAVGALQRRHEYLLRLRQHLVGWQTRLHSRELAWEIERERAQAAARAREEVTEQQLRSVAHLRQRWTASRREESEAAARAQQHCERAREEYMALSEERRQQVRELLEQRRELTTKALAVEQYRQQCLTRAEDAASADRRIEKFRRRWEAAQDEAIRSYREENERLQLELAMHRNRYGELAARLEQATDRAHRLAEQQAESEQQQLRLQTAAEKLRLQLHSVQAQFERSEQFATQMQGEVERIARVLLEEPAPPPILLEQPEPEEPYSPPEARAA